LEFLDDGEIANGLYQVLFVVDADPSIITSKIFADISEVSAFKDKDTVLFTIRCSFI